MKPYGALQLRSGFGLNELLDLWPLIVLWQVVKDLEPVGFGGSEYVHM